MRNDSNQEININTNDQNSNANLNIKNNNIIIENIDANTDNDTNNSNNEFNQDTQINFNLLFFIRIFLIIFALSLVTLNTVYGFALPQGNLECFEDKLHIFTSDLNSFFLTHISSRNVLLIFSSLCVDISIVTMGVLWLLYGKSWRILVSMVFFYVLRAIVQVFIFFEIYLEYFYNEIS